MPSKKKKDPLLAPSEVCHYRYALELLLLKKIIMRMFFKI